MKCPSCNKENHCGCPKCRSIYGDRPDMQIDVTKQYPGIQTSGMRVWKCPYCGHTATESHWAKIAKNEPLNKENQ